MTDRELKKLLKDAYNMPKTESGQRFIKKYKRRSRQLNDIIWNEFRYMGMKSIFAGILLCIIFGGIAKIVDSNMMWIASSIIPISSIVPMSLIFRSERYNMSELEAASRFSLRFIRLIRMFILGIFSGVIVLCGSVIFKHLWICGMIDIVMFIIFPYLVSVWGSLFITRKYHGNDSSIAIFTVCIMTGFLPIIIRSLRELHFVSDYMYVLFSGIILWAIIKECMKYINVSEYLLSLGEA